MFWRQESRTSSLKKLTLLQSLSTLPRRVVVRRQTSPPYPRAMRSETPPPSAFRQRRKKRIAHRVAQQRRKPLSFPRPQSNPGRVAPASSPLQTTPCHSSSAAFPRAPLTRDPGQKHGSSPNTKRPPKMRSDRWASANQ